jgi:hypothetical protein
MRPYAFPGAGMGAARELTTQGVAPWCVENIVSRGMLWETWYRNVVPPR